MFRCRGRRVALALADPPPLCCRPRSHEPGADPTTVSWEYLHLVSNPFSIVLVTVGSLAGLAGWLVGSEQLERYGVMSLLLGALFTVPAFVTGLTAADVVEQRTFVEPSLMHAHRSWAIWTIVVLGAEGVFAGFSLFQPDDARLRRFVLVAGLLCAGLVAYTAYLGGRLNHADVSPFAASSETPGPDRAAVVAVLSDAPAVVAPNVASHPKPTDPPR